MNTPSQAATTISSRPSCVDVDELQVVDRMQRSSQRPRRARRVAGRFGNVVNEDADPLPLPPVRSLGPASLQGGDHELLVARPFHVAEAQPVQRRLFECDRVKLPAALAVAAQPLERARSSWCRSAASPPRVRNRCDRRRRCHAAECRRCRGRSCRERFRAFASSGSRTRSRRPRSRPRRRAFRRRSRRRP